MSAIDTSVRPELVEGSYFLFSPSTGEGQGFDKLGPNGFLGAK